MSSKSVRGYWSTRREKNKRSTTDESRTRTGQWTRSFSIRNDSWGIIEHWASEHGFHLTAIKGKRRLYRKGYQPALFLSYLDVKHDENQITLTAWIEVGIVARLISLLTLPRELQINPRGFNGILQRRQACRELNLLLDRFKQSAILGSGGLHIGDLDLSTMLLLASFVPASLFYLYSTGILMEVRPGLAQSLLSAAGRPLGAMAGIGLILVLAHQFIAIRRFNRMVWRLISVVIGATVYATTALILLSQVSVNMRNEKVAYFCLQYFQSAPCDRALSGLSQADREVVVQRIKILEKELAAKPEHTGQ
jgi:hypothetical protein